jgi:CheY-like chemotaxis protein
MLTEIPTAYHLEWADTLAKGLQRLAQGAVDVLLLDLNLPDSQGLHTFDVVAARAPSLPIVVLSGLLDEDLARTAIQRGAQDYLLKGKVDGYHLTHALGYAIERKQHAEGQRFLAEVGRVLAGSLDETTLIQQVARLAVSFLADSCIVDLVDENQVPSATAIAHRDPTEEAAMRTYRQHFPLDVIAHPPLADVLQTGQATVYPHLSEIKGLESTRSPEQLAAERALGFLSGMFVPLIARGRTLGAICLFTARPGWHFGPDDLARATGLRSRPPWRLTMPSSTARRPRRSRCGTPPCRPLRTTCGTP